MKKMTAVYQTIAVDIAKRIVNADFVVGDKISGRTLLASQYNVSPETIRKAISILKEANIVAVSQGKEVIVMSSQQAYHFIEHTKEMASAYSLRQDLEILLARKEENDKSFHKIVGEIMSYSDRLKNLAPYNPVEIRMAEKSGAVGKSLEELRLWHHTGATVVAIRRGMEIIVSPGPYAVIEAGDRIVVVGPQDVLQKVIEYIKTIK